MHVAVDETGEQGLSGKVDDALVSARLSIGRHRAGLRNPARVHPDKASVERFVSNPVHEARIDEDDCGFTGDKSITIGFLHGRTAARLRGSLRPKGSSSHSAAL